MTRLGIVAIAVIAMPLGAQTLQPEIRAELMGPRPYAVEPGIGVIMPLGTYARVGAVAGYAIPLESDHPRARWRADLVVRATFDPFRQQRRALSLGAGLTYRRSRTYLVAVADLEGRELRGLLPAIQVGVGGGLRAGIVFRRAMPGRR